MSANFDQLHRILVATGRASGIKMVGMMEVGAAITWMG